MGIIIDKIQNILIAFFVGLVVGGIIGYIVGTKVSATAILLLQGVII